MKHLRLFLALFTLLIGGASASAQTWTGSAPENGKVYYLYNVGKNLYLTGDNDWGTHASCTRYGVDFTFAMTSEGVYTLDSKISNGGNSHFLNGNYVDGAAQNWTFTATGDADNSYYLNNGSGNLYSVSSSSYVEVGNITDDYAKWILLTKEDIIEQMQAATKDSPVDVTVLISAANRSRNNQRNDESWTITRSGGNWNTNQYSDWPAIESWNNTFEYSQTLTGMPLGDYKIGCAGFGTNGTTMLFINDAESPLTNTAISSSFGTNYQAAARSIHEEEGGIMGNVSDFITVSSSTMKLGLKRTTNRAQDWAVFDKFNLMYYGLDLSSFETALANAVSKAVELEGTIPTTAYNTLMEFVNEKNKTYTTIDDYTNATNDIIEKTNEAKNLQAPYNNYKIARANVVALKSQTTYTDEGGAAATQLDTDVAAADAVNEAATTVAEINAAIQQVRTAAGSFAGSVTINRGQYLDLTDAMLFNAAMRETGGLSLWNIVNNTNTNYPKYNGRCSEFWNANFEFNQTAYNLPAGNYNIEVYAFHRAGTYNTYLYANDDKIQVLPITNGENSMEAAANSFDQGLYLNSLKITLDEAQNVIIGFKNEDSNETDKWTIFRDFKIKFFGDDALAVYREEYENALAEAQAALASNDYSNITGEERTSLNTITTETYPITVVEVDETQEKFETATQALKDATTAFKNAKAAYDAFAAAKTAAANNKVDYPYASEEKLQAYQSNLIDATNASDANTKATAIVTTYRAYVESNALAEGVEGAENLTNLIKQDAISDWTSDITGSDAVFVLKSDADTYTAADGTLGTNLIDSGDLWGANSWNAKLTQDITLTAGRYILTASARGSADLSTFKLIVDDESVDMDHIGSAIGVGTFDRGFNDFYVEFTVTDNEGNGKDVTIGFEAATEAVHNWCSVARFRLARLENYAAWATAEDYAALSNAIQAAENNLGFEEGEYAPYNNVEVLQALAAAKSIDPTTNNTQISVQTAIANIAEDKWQENTVEVNAVYDGTFAAAEHNGAPAGWSMSNNTLGGATHSRAFNPDNRLSEFNETNSGLFLRFDGTFSSRGSLYYYGNTEGYTMPLKENTTYYVKVDFAGWGSTGKPLRLNVTGPAGFTTVSQQYNTSVRADIADNTPQQFYIVFTTADAGNYVINFQTPGADTNTHMVLVSNIELFKVRQETITIKKGFTGTTYSSENALDFTNSGLTAYIITGAADGECAITAVTKVPARTGVYVEGEAVNNDADTPYAVNVYGGNDPDNVNENLLVGTGANPVELPSSESFTYYLFGKQNGKESFFRVGTASPRTVPEHKAYLAIPGSNNAKAFVIVRPNDDLVSDDGGFADGINNVEQDGNNAKIYNLNGQRVNNAQKGIYIKNGKKVIIK